MQQRVPAPVSLVCNQQPPPAAAAPHIMSIRFVGLHVGNVSDGCVTPHSPPHACARAARAALLPSTSAPLEFAKRDMAHTSTMTSRSGCSVGDDASALKSPVMI
jgi:hypothetical protein